MKLIDICDFQGGSQPPKEEWSFEEQEGYIRMLQIRDFTQSERVAPEYIKISKSTKMCEADDILIARYGASIGKILTGLSGAYNVAIMRTIPDTSKIIKKYLYYYLKSPYFQNNILNVGSRAAQAGFNKEDLSKLDIECPELLEQENIVSILDKVEILIGKRKEELTFLDNLIKARFVELFGDPDNNAKNWDIDKMEHLCEVGSSKRIYQNEQSMEGVPFLRISDLVNRIDTGSKKSDLYIPIAKFAELKEQGLVPRFGDILLTARGTLGRCYIVQPDDEFYFQDGMITWLSNYDRRITALYISYLFEMPGFRKQIDALQAGSTVAYMSISMTKKLNVMVPPVELQEQFADFVRAVDKSKVAVQKALDETQKLFDSLMQQYFG